MKFKTTKEEFEDIILNSLSIADVCRTLGLVPVGGNYRTIKSKILLWDVNISHFTGQGWNKGEKYRQVRIKQSMESILVENSTYTSTDRLKSRLINEGYKKYECENDNCHINTWHEEKISLELHHNNGNNLDNRIENLKLLCPNCHSQTDNFRGCNKKSEKNSTNKIKYGELILKKRRENKKRYFCKCGNEIKKLSKTCKSCNISHQRKVERPELTTLLNDIKEIGYSATGRKYGVSDNAIRKWINNGPVIQMERNIFS